eukprot:TRINITY_DN11327_c0_g1_i1.p1 TRINITY_DN11327_c0_g1~~TRINITY_DN11327_c0_g1_i1.p1  ORF type:complete len:245 (+),score=28.63 TRINITY_DN11327_c0_g1_i1:61-795(+)
MSTQQQVMLLSRQARATSRRCSSPIQRSCFQACLDEGQNALLSPTKEMHPRSPSPSKTRGDWMPSPPPAPRPYAKDLGSALMKRSMRKMLEEIDRDPYLVHAPVGGLPPLVAACTYGCSPAMLTKLARLGGSLPPSDEALPALAGGPSAILDDGAEDANEESNRVLSALCLLRAGANPKARDASGCNAADVARQAGRPLLAEWVVHWEDMQTCKVLRSICSKSSLGSEDGRQVFSVVLRLPEVM